MIAPGIHQMTADSYFALETPTPALSSSIARKLLGYSPLHAWYAHPVLNPGGEREEKEAYDIGTAAHALLLDAAQRSQEQMHEVLEALCAAEIPGDTHRNLRIHPQYSAQTFKHVLVPVWLLSYNFGRRAFQVIVNGYTGQIAGKYPYSVWKIVLLVLVVVIVAIVVITLNQG